MMPKLNFDYDAARDAGYSDAAILDGLKAHGQLDFDLDAARKKGYDDSEILQGLLGTRRAAEKPKEEESSSLLRRVGDLGLSAIKGIVSVPEAIVGLADIPTGGAAGRAAESLGVKFKETKDILSDYYSPEQKAANQRVADAKGFVDTAATMLANPSTLVQTGVESLPSMLGGAAIGRGALALAPRLGAVAAGAIGEGVIGAGQSAEQIRQQTANGSLSAGQAGAALASGIGTGIFGMVGGRIAQKLGIADIDTALVQAGAKETSKGVARRMIEGGISEGVFEELPQSVQEQIWQNAAMDRPLLEGVPEQAAQGMLAGGLFGGVAGGALNNKPAAAPAQSQEQPGATPLLTNNPEPLVSFPDGSVGRQSDVDGFLAGLPEDERAAARARLYGYEPQAVTPEDVLRAQSVDEAIAVAERATAEATPEMRAQKDAAIDAAWQQYLAGVSAQREQEFAAAEQARRDADVPAMQEQAADQAVAQAGALTAAQGFDEQQPTAMQLAMQEAQARRQAAIETAAQRRAAAAKESANATATATAAETAAVGTSDADAGATAPAPAPAAGSIMAPAGASDSAAASPDAGTVRTSASVDVTARARAILNAAGVTGNERMAALRAVRTGENTLEDLIDAHPPKEMTNATPPTDASAVPGRYPAGDTASAPVQQASAPGRETVPQPADLGSGDTTAAGVPAAGDVRDGAGAAAAASGELTGDAPRASRAPAAAPDLADLGDGFTVQGRTLLRDGEPVGDVKIEYEPAAGKAPAHIRLADIRVARKGGGTGSAAIQALLARARETGLPVALSTEAGMGKSHQQRLRALYERLGFRKNSGADRIAGISEEYVWTPDAPPRASVAEQQAAPSPTAASDQPDAGMSAADVTRAITRLRAKWIGFTRINVVQSTSDLPADIAGRTNVDEFSEGFYDPRSKSVYLIADNLASAERAAWVAAHEVVGHGGLRMLHDKSVNEALNLASANRFVRDLAAAIEKDRGDVAGTVAIEEAVAELAAAIETDDFETLADRYRVTVPAASRNGVRGVVARVIESVRRFLAQIMGQLSAGVSDAAVREMIGQQQAAAEGRASVDRPAGAEPARASVIRASERTIEIDGERRPITDSTGKQIGGGDFDKQRAFYEWFGDSAVVDEAGRPLVVYHGTGNDFGRFDTRRNDLGSHFGTAEQANQAAAGKKAGVIMPAYLRIEKPLRIIDRGDFNADTVSQQLEEAGLLSKAQADEFFNAAYDEDVKPRDLIKQLQRQIEAAGYDGVVYLNRQEGLGADYTSSTMSDEEFLDEHPTARDSWIAFRPEQVKSATGNAGTFDPDNADIRASRAAAAPAQNAAGEERIPKWAADLTPAQQAALRKSGAIYTEKTAKQKVKELTDGAMKKLQYGILDQFAPIKDQLGKIPYIMARMAKNADGTLEALMLYGRPHLDADGGMLVDTTKKGFIETMQQLDGEHDRFFSWLAGRRAAQLKTEGRENLFTDDDISALATLNQGTMKDGRSREAAYLRAQKDVAELNKSVLDIAEASGLIDAESRRVWQSDFYVPFYRVMEEGVTGPSVKSGLVNQKSIKKLKGGTNSLNDLTKNMLMNWSTLLTASAKNRAAKASLDAAVGMGAASEAPEATIRAMAKSAQTKAVSYMESGTNRWFVVEDEHLLAAISALEFSGYNNGAMKVMSAFKNYLTRAITISPFFKVRNLIRDSLSVIAVSNAGYNPVANLRNGYSLLRKDHIKAQLIAGGAIYRFGTYMEGNRAENVKRLIDDGVPEDTILNTAEKMAKFTRKLYQSYENLGDMSENLNRAALYQKLRDEGKSHLEASFEARDLMDFGLSGAWAGVRALNQILPFFNARLQGLYKLGRGYNDDPKRMGYVVGALALITMGFAMHYKDDDDWKKRSDSDRANYWWWKVGGTAYRLPKPFEIGAMATAIDEFAALFYDSENTDAKRFGQQLGELVNGQLAMNPIPQVFRPVLDIYANKDAFTGRPIESLAMQRLKPEDRYTYNTSELARMLSKSGLFVDPLTLVSGAGVKQLSPVQIDALVKGYFAGVGVLAVSAVDGLLHHTVIDRGEALPVPLRTLTGSFMEELPTTSSRYVDMLYNTAQDVEQSYASYQNAIKSGDIDKARQIMKDEGGTLAKYHMIESLKKNESRINQVIQRTRNSKELTGQQKEETIRRLKILQDQIARRMVTGK